MWEREWDGLPLAHLSHDQVGWQSRHDPREHRHKLHVHGVAAYARREQFRHGTGCHSHRTRYGSASTHLHDRRIIWGLGEALWQSEEDASERKADYTKLGRRPG